MTTLGENLKKIRKAKKMTQIQLAKKSGVKQSVISDLETGNAKSTGFILELANALGVTAEELKKGIVREIESSNAVAVKARMAPVLSWVQAGTFTNVSAVDTSEITEWLPLPEDECSNCFFLKVQGLSNHPYFMEGDYIVVDPDAYYGDMQSGDIIVVRRGEDATFKKLVIETNGKRYLQALNPEFKPNIIELDDQCLFIGQVVDCVRYVYKARPRIKRN
ncbi:LexA family protein [Acinetobacter variabilis]|uniref:LexA family protein n=1 Tax=Acinetobacter variabilis TaxID=70346 RepID=UPI001330F465|nr:S24 family peptidase [Acinetobacter variabilis]